MDDTEHSLTKLIVQTVVGTAIAYVFSSTLTTVVPPTRKYKIADMAGSVVATKLVSKFESNINQFVDSLYERRKARKLKLF